MTIFRRGPNLLSVKKSLTKVVISSKGTLSQQESLLKLPLPSLSETIEKWLPTTLPHLSNSEYQVTKQVANDFIQNAEPLQKFLSDRATQKDNWFSDWWLDMAYLAYRDPLPVWSSPGIVLGSLSKEQGFSSEEEWLLMGAKLTVAALEYKYQLDLGIVPVEMSGKNPMDMRQYYRLFGANRIPGKTKDAQIVKGNSNHIVICHRGLFFKLKILDDNGNHLSLTQVYQSLCQVLEEVRLRHQQSSEACQVGLLTSNDRDSWFESYNALKDAGNAKAIADIENSLFLLCLDQSISSTESSPLAKTALNSLHGHGQLNGSNRWFDKALQFIVAKSGEVAISNEHSFAEAVPTMSIADFCIDYIHRDEFPTLAALSQKPIISHIPFELNDEIRKKINEASRKIDKLHADLEMKVLDFHDFGKEFIKSQKISPDSFVQMGIALAFRRLHNVPAATYESAATRIFSEGRTEVIRSCLPETVRFTQMMTIEDSNLNNQMNAFKAALKAHNAYARSAAQGQGVDRHLQGLKMAALELGQPLPAIFSDPGYLRSSRMRLSTSQISSRHSSFCCYGPLQTDGYGCSYSIGSNSLQFSVSALNSDQETSAAKFASQLQDSLLDLHDLCVSSKPKL